MSNIEIKTDSIHNDDVKNLILVHLGKMKEGTPKESVHALELDAFNKPEITLWSLWVDGSLAGIGALKELNPIHGEIKSMRTADAFLRMGVAEKILLHIISEAKKRGYKQLSLETGSAEPFRPAHKLYEKLGFITCGPFEGYKLDPNSLFMTKIL